jgi:hypothetical protein
VRPPAGRAHFLQLIQRIAVPKPDEPWKSSWKYLQRKCTVCHSKSAHYCVSCGEGVFVCHGSKRGCLAAHIRACGGDNAGALQPSATPAATLAPGAFALEGEDLQPASKVTKKQKRDAQATTEV